ncbi:hypothetical protein FKM82_022254 [Ascaphus truei]
MHLFLKNYFKILKFKPFLPRLLINFHVSQTRNSCASQTCNSCASQTCNSCASQTCNSFASQTCNSCDLSVKKGEGREMRKRGVQ